MQDQQRRELLDLILKVSFERRRVILASGRESDFYLDLRQTLMRPRGLVLAGALVLERLAQEGIAPQAVGGMAVGAVPLIAAVLAAADGDARFADLVGFFVRKEAKSHGLGRRIEGGFQAGQRVVLVEDTTTTGGSTLEAYQAVKEAGAEVLGVVSLVDRSEGAVEAFALQGLSLWSVFSRRDLPV